MSCARRVSRLSVTTSLLCVVESPADVVAVEQSGSFRGRYFVLMGHLSPLDGIGPDQLGVRELEGILDEGVVQELILATNPTVEGEATAHFLSDIASKRGIRATRIAHGVPIGGELEYVDGGTLAHALSGRQSFTSLQSCESLGQHGGRYFGPRAFTRSSNSRRMRL